MLLLSSSKSKQFTKVVRLKQCHRQMAEISEIEIYFNRLNFNQLYAIYDIYLSLQFCFFAFLCFVLFIFFIHSTFVSYFKQKISINFWFLRFLDPHRSISWLVCVCSILIFNAILFSRLFFQFGHMILEFYAIFAAITATKCTRWFFSLLLRIKCVGEIRYE